MKLTCIIIEDEPFAQKLLESYVIKTPVLSLLGIFNNPLESISFLQQSNVDVIFLDIEMPEINGLEFVKSMNKQSHIIFTTAYSQHAVESYERGAIDYLLKPINYDRFLKAVNRIPLRTEVVKQTVPDEPDSIYVRTNRTYIRISHKDLFYIEGLKDYVIFKTSQNKHIVHTNLKKLESSLPANFVRVHNSYIINFDKMIEFKDNHVQCLDIRIPVSKKYHEAFMKRINERLI